MQKNWAKVIRYMFPVMGSGAGPVVSAFVVVAVAFLTAAMFMLLAKLIAHYLR